MLLKAAAAPALITTRRRNTHMTYVSSILMISSWPYKPLMAVEFLTNLFLCNRVSYIVIVFFLEFDGNHVLWYVRKSNCDGIQKMISSVRHRLEVLWHWPTAKPMCKKPQDHLEKEKQFRSSIIDVFLRKWPWKKRIKNGLIKRKLYRVEIRAFLPKHWNHYKNLEEIMRAVQKESDLLIFWRCPWNVTSNEWHPGDKLFQEVIGCWR